MGQLKVNSITDEAGTGPVEFPLMPEVNGNPVIERGSNANGEFVRYADGTQICTKTFLNIGPINLTYGSAFRSNDFSSGSAPAAFVTSPFVHYVARGNTSLIPAVGPFADPSSGTNLGSFMLFRPGSSAATGWEVDLTAIGRWF